MSLFASQCGCGQALLFWNRIDHDDAGADQCLSLRDVA